MTVETESRRESERELLDRSLQGELVHATAHGYTRGARANGSSGCGWARGARAGDMCGLCALAGERPVVNYAHTKRETQ